MCSCATGIFHLKPRLLLLVQLRSCVSQKQRSTFTFHKDVGKQKEQRDSVDQNTIGAMAWLEPEVEFVPPPDYAPEAEDAAPPPASAWLEPDAAPVGKIIFSQDVSKQKEQSVSVDQNKIGALVGKIIISQDDIYMHGEPGAEVCSGSTPPKLSCECLRFDSVSEPEVEANPQEELTDCWHKGAEQREGTSNAAAIQAAPADKEPVSFLSDNCTHVASSWAGVARDHFQSLRSELLPTASIAVDADAAQGDRLEAALGEQRATHEKPEGSKNRDEDVEKPTPVEDKDVEKPAAVEDEDVERPLPAEDKDVIKPAPAVDRDVEKPMPAEDADVEKPAPAGDEDVEKRVAGEPPVIEYSLEQLTNQLVWRKLGVEPTAREKLLGDVTFQELFGMDKHAFAKLPKWKQNTLKKKIGLF